MVTVDYVLKDTGGTVLDSSSNTGPMRFIQGAGQVFPAIEQALAGLEPGARVDQPITAAEGFGERDEARIIQVRRDQLPPDVGVGTVVSAPSPQGHPIPLTIVEMNDDTARLDGNHPLAGKDLVFELTVKNVEGIKQATH